MIGHGVAAQIFPLCYRLPHLLIYLGGIHKLRARFLYGSGLRLMECLRLRIQDVCLEDRPITGEGGKGEKDRTVPLLETAISELRRRIERVRRSPRETYPPSTRRGLFADALEKKYPLTAREFIRQYPTAGPQRYADGDLHPRPAARRPGDAFSAG